MTTARGRWLTQIDTARALGCSRMTIYRHVRRGTIVMREIQPGVWRVDRRVLPRLRAIVGSKPTIAQREGRAPALTTAERQVRAWRGRMRGETLEVIRAALGYASLSGVRRAIEAGRRRMAREEVTAYGHHGRLRRLEAARRDGVGVHGAHRRSRRQW